jgi:hypothetical protein
MEISFGKICDYLSGSSYLKSLSKPGLETQSNETVYEEGQRWGFVQLYTRQLECIDSNHHHIQATQERGFRFGGDKAPLIIAIPGQAGEVVREMGLNLEKIWRRKPPPYPIFRKSKQTNRGN